MFGILTEKLQGVLGRILQNGQLSETQLKEASQEIRAALLEADVALEVANRLVERLAERSLGAGRLTGVSAGQQFAKAVFDELVALMGSQESQPTLQGSPAVVMLCGLQGCGKTTTAAKLARWWSQSPACKKTLVVACDLQRPAAVEQLRLLAEQIGVGFVGPQSPGDRPLDVAREGIRKARAEGFDLVIVDTAGRLHVDAQLMDELQILKSVIRPSAVWLVVNAGQGQDALHSATAFHQRMQLTGSILTMLDGTARAGVAVSLYETIRAPILFEGVGERPEDLRVFNPTSMAHRILGMGDTINLVKAAEEHIPKEKAESLGKRVMSGNVTYDDFLEQTAMVQRLGSFKGVLKMLPAGMFGGVSPEQLLQGEGLMKTYTAIIRAMTPQERAESVDLSQCRKERIARGAGVDIEQVNKLVKSFRQMKQVMKNMPNMKMLGKMMGGLKWP